MPDDQPAPPGGANRDNPPTDRPTDPLASPPPAPPPSAPGQPGYGPQYGGQPPGYGQPGYGQPYGAPAGYGYGYPPASQTDSSATAALVIAIAGFFICPPVGAIVALVLANSAQKRIEASGGQLTGLDQAKAARIIAIIELVLTAVLIVGAVLAITLSLGARY
jgi:hypothetical protein